MAKVIGASYSPPGGEPRPVTLYGPTGVPLLFDSSNKVPVSLYGKGTVAGDTAVELVTQGSHKLVKVGMYVNGGYLVENLPDNSDGQDFSSSRMMAVGSLNYLFNGASRDRQRGNVALALLASAARTAETSSSDTVNYNHTKILLVVNVSSMTATPVLTPKLQIKDSISSAYVTVWTAAANITATGTYAYLFAIGGSGGAGGFTEVASLLVGRTWRFTMSVADTDSATYSVSADLLL